MSASGGARPPTVPFFERDGEIEVRVGVVRIQAKRFDVAVLRLVEAAEVVIDVAQIEVRLEEI